MSTATPPRNSLRCPEVPLWEVRRQATCSWQIGTTTLEGRCGGEDPGIGGRTADWRISDRLSTGRAIANAPYKRSQATGKLDCCPRERRRWWPHNSLRHIPSLNAGATRGRFFALRSPRLTTL